MTIYFHLFWCYIWQIYFYSFSRNHPVSQFSPFSPLSPSTSEIWSIWKAKFSYLYLKPLRLTSAKYYSSTCALWLLMPARQEKIMGESVRGAGKPRRDSHWSGGKENTSPTWLRGMFTAPGITPSVASSWGWRGNCEKSTLSKYLSHINNKDILGGQGSAKLLIGGGGRENSGGRRRRWKKSQEGRAWRK